MQRCSAIDIRHKSPTNQQNMQVHFWCWHGLPSVVSMIPKLQQTEMLRRSTWAHYYWALCVVLLGNFFSIRWVFKAYTHITKGALQAAGCLPFQHETVRVSPLGSRGGTRGEDAGLLFSPRSAVTQRIGRVDLQVNLEYMQGCQRAHAAWLTVPVTAPFRYGCQTNTELLVHMQEHSS